jgi:flagellar motor component MotA
MKALTYILSFILITVALFLLALFSGTSLFVFLDIPSLLLAGILGWLGLFLSFTPAEVIRAVITLVSKGPSSRQDLAKGKAVFRALLRSTLIAGGIGSVFGIICALTNLTDTEAIGTGLAMALLTLLYSLLTAFLIAAPAEAALASRLADLDQDPPGQK